MMRKRRTTFAAYAFCAAVSLSSCSLDRVDESTPFVIQGVDGVDGQSGQDGFNGTHGQDGQNGVSCWDKNQNGLEDPEEDTNGDGYVDVLDCTVSCKYPLVLAVKDPKGYFGDKGEGSCHWNWSSVIINTPEEYLVYLLYGDYLGQSVPYPSQTFILPYGLAADDFDCIQRNRINL